VFFDYLKFFYTGGFIMQILCLITENREWIFSGIGVAVFSFILSLFIKIIKRKTKVNKNNKEILFKLSPSCGISKGH